MTAGGAALAFLLAAIVTGLDAQAEAHKRIGRIHGTAIAGHRAGWAFFCGWGLCGAVVFLVLVTWPDWAKDAFQVDLQKNEFLTGAVVGGSLMAIVRLRLATFGALTLSLEPIYQASTNWLLSQINDRRARARRDARIAERRFFKDIAGYPHYFSSLEGELLERTKSHSDDIKTLLEVELKRLKDQDPAPDGKEGLREAIWGIADDRCGPEMVSEWQASTDHGNRR